MNILAIGAHPDDIEIFMFGFLLECKKMDYEINLIVATDGSRGGKNKKNLKKIRYQETKKALSCLSKPIFLNFPDGYLGSIDVHQIKIKEYIEKMNPDLIVTHDTNDYHSDHIMLSKMVTLAAGHFIPVLYCDTLMGINFKPDYYVDITEHFQIKLNAINKHVSQNPKRFLELAKLMNSYRSAQCNAPLGTFAEAFRFKKSFPFSDIRNLLPKSPVLRPFYIEEIKGFL